MKDFILVAAAGLAYGAGVFLGVAAAAHVLGVVNNAVHECRKNKTDKPEPDKPKDGGETATA